MQARHGHILTGSPATLALAIAAALIALLTTSVPAPAVAPDRPRSTGYQEVFVGLSCDGAGFIKQYNGLALDMSPNRTVETYFNFQYPTGTVSYGHNESNLRSSSTGSLRTSTFEFVQSVFVAVQFNIYYPYPDDSLFQSQWRYCGGGAAVAG